MLPFLPETVRTIPFSSRADRVFGQALPKAALVRQIAKARSTEWVVYAKAPFAGPEQVLDYVGRYTHRVAISNNRLLDIEQGQVSFRWKDYRQDSERKTMTLSADEFIRRFLLHVLPDGFLANRYRREKLAQCRQLLGMRAAEATAAAGPPKDYRDRYEELTGCALRECPQCHRGRMVVVELLPRIPGRLPPPWRADSRAMPPRLGSGHATVEVLPCCLLAARLPGFS